MFMITAFYKISFSKTLNQMEVFNMGFLATYELRPLVNVIYGLPSSLFEPTYIHL